MHEFSARPGEMWVSLKQNRELISASIKREVLGRYRGSVIGVFWSMLTPLLMLAVYTFVFGEIFTARWSSGSDSKTEFALVLFAGLIVFNLFSECIGRAPILIISNPNYVKKVLYPLEILPWVSFGSGFFHMLVSLGVWLLAYVVFIGLPHLSILYLPLVIIPYILFIIGLSWILASLGVFLRDISQFIGIVIMAMLFLSPIFYASDTFPERYRILLFLNPLTPIIELTRDVLYWGYPPDFTVLSIYFFSSALFAWLGFSWFQKTRKGFADVI